MPPRLNEHRIEPAQNQNGSIGYYAPSGGPASGPGVHRGWVGPGAASPYKHSFCVGPPPFLSSGQGFGAFPSSQLGKEARPATTSTSPFDTTSSGTSIRGIFASPTRDLFQQNHVSQFGAGFESRLAPFDHLIDGVHKPERGSHTGLAPQIRVAHYVEDREIFRARNTAGEAVCRPAVDMWSLGLLLYGMVLGQLPFEHQMEAMVYDRIIHARFSIPSKVSLGFRRLIQGILVVDPKKRFTLKQVLESPWMSEGLEKVKIDEPAPKKYSTPADKTLSDSGEFAGIIPSTELDTTIPESSAIGAANEMFAIQAAPMGPRNVISGLRPALPMQWSRRRAPPQMRSFLPHRSEPEIRSMAKRTRRQRPPAEGDPNRVAIYEAVPICGAVAPTMLIPDVEMAVPTSSVLNVIDEDFVENGAVMRAQNLMSGEKDADTAASPTGLDGARYFNAGDEAVTTCAAVAPTVPVGDMETPSVAAPMGVLHLINGETNTAAPSTGFENAGNFIVGEEAVSAFVAVASLVPIPDIEMRVPNPRVGGAIEEPLCENAGIRFSAFVGTQQSLLVETDTAEPTTAVNGPGIEPRAVAGSEYLKNEGAERSGADEPAGLSTLVPSALQISTFRNSANLRAARPSSPAPSAAPPLQPASSSVPEPSPFFVSRPSGSIISESDDNGELTDRARVPGLGLCAHEEEEEVVVGVLEVVAFLRGVLASPRRRGPAAPAAPLPTQPRPPSPNMSERPKDAFFSAGSEQLTIAQPTRTKLRSKLTTLGAMPAVSSLGIGAVPSILTNERGTAAPSTSIR
ncbi:hypothetical protein BDK51DRAFT_44604 [Blyttiomyces helicus]|uniref:Protein kinase domain-containing protein n=1 Tax=Blyttiomyces helicus TaxID=388810 RepID=A0A4P9WN93_9FUNG|nr:hypothetical protein BDK51DRAFT_44604 [Blyttiomyces helicus]|eukprot:RKO92226.1 hypothetical protein BDK51DRAFT_44604 [Blyttiomyces helicus]